MDNNHRRNRAFFLAALGLAGIVLLFVFKPTNRQWFENTGIAWNTEYHIKYYGTTDLSDSITAMFREIELSVSPFNRSSRIYAINHNETDSLDSYLKKLYLRSAEIHKETNGAFDPTVSPLVNAWGFGYEQGKNCAAAIDSIRRFVGLEKTSLSGNKIRKSDNRISFNFSSIAKGMGCDEIGLMLKRNGITDYMVEIGGEIAAKGKNPKRSAWKISIDRPIAANDTVIHESAGIIGITDCGIATSGNYRNYKTDSTGKKYAHTINPATGYPEQTDILSATVIAPDCMTADAYATAFMVLGSKRTKALVALHPELSVCLFTTDNTGNISQWHSPNFPFSENK